MSDGDNNCLCREMWKQGDIGDMLPGFVMTLWSQSPPRVLLPSVTQDNRTRPSSVQKQRKASLFDPGVQTHELTLESTHRPAGGGPGCFIGSRQRGEEKAEFSRGWEWLCCSRDHSAGCSVSAHGPPPPPPPPFWIECRVQRLCTRRLS